MNANIFDVESDVLIEVLASSDGDLGLAAERICAKLKLPFNSINEYDLQERIVRFDQATTDTMAGKLRSLFIIKMYHLLTMATRELESTICDLPPAVLAKTQASLSTTFNNLTMPATKVTFDFASEIAAIAKEFPDTPVEDIKAELKELEKIRVVK